MSHKSILATVVYMALHLNPASADESQISSNSPVAASSALEPLIDAFFNYANATSPEEAVLYGRDDLLPTLLRDNSKVALIKEQQHEDDLLKQLALISPQSLQTSADKTSYEILQHLLHSAKAMRVCRNELWNINHLVGWQATYPQIITMQPVETPQQRANTLARWQHWPTFIETEMANLRAGLAAGYSAPKSVVMRVVDMLDEIVSLSDEDSPLMAPAFNSDDHAFNAQWQALVSKDIKPALQRYITYLKTDYYPHAREALGLASQPNGVACYSAYYYMQTGIHRSPEEVYEQGKALVKSNMASILSLGKTQWDLDEFDAIVAKAKALGADSFTQQQDVVDFSNAKVARSKSALSTYFQFIPTQPMVVEAWPEQYKGAGVQNTYQPRHEGQSHATYRINAFEPTKQNAGQVEITAYHEGYPGHHLQMATAQALATSTPIQEYYGNSTYTEGWGRYAEQLADEMGLYEQPSANILRKTWPGRGMVVDPGLHLFGWTRQQAVEYINQSGRFKPSFGESLVDRIAVLPAQLTTYDSGALEFLRLRAKAQSQLGEQFDIKTYHQLMLEDGAVPMAMLEQKITTWINSKK
jgi:uncharacterized protein (DUF885 family)